MSNRSSHSSQREHEVEENASHRSDDETSLEKNKYDLHKEHPILGLIIFTAIQFITLLLVVVATPIEMFVMNDTWTKIIWPEAGTGKKICVTAWGMKRGCRSVKYYDRNYVTNFCFRVHINFRIIEAFCIMTIGFMTLGLLMGVLSIFQKVGKGSTGSIGTFAMVLCIIPWGIIVGMYYQKPCCDTDWADFEKPVTTCGFNAKSRGVGDVPAFKHMAKYGAGFGLIVAAWALQVIACVFAFLPF